MVRKFLPVILLAPLTIAACSSGSETSQTGTTSTTAYAYQDQQARQMAQQALSTAQQAQATANDAKREADRMNQRSLQK
jgi:outer membrane murein-binding lipoprotein Lpp